MSTSQASRAFPSAHGDRRAVEAVGDAPGAAATGTVREIRAADYGNAVIVVHTPSANPCASVGVHEVTVPVADARALSIGDEVEITVTKVDA